MDKSSCDSCYDSLALENHKQQFWCPVKSPCEFNNIIPQVNFLCRLSDAGGGICFYIKSTVNFSMQTDLNIDELENLCIEIHKPNSKPFIVVNWYRPPNSPIIGLFSHLENLIARLDLTNLEFFLLGDRNVDMASTNYDDVRQLTNIADIYGLHQLISDPTRITDKSSTLIDLIFTNCPERVVCSGVAQLSVVVIAVLFMCFVTFD